MLRTVIFVFCITTPTLAFAELINDFDQHDVVSYGIGGLEYVSFRGLTSSQTLFASANHEAVTVSTFTATPTGFDWKFTQTTDGFYSVGDRGPVGSYSDANGYAIFTNTTFTPFEFTALWSGANGSFFVMLAEYPSGGSIIPNPGSSLSTHGMLAPGKYILQFESILATTSNHLPLSASGEVSFNIVSSHVPEPSSIVSMASGIAIALAAGLIRRIRGECKTGFFAAEEFSNPPVA